MARRDDIVRFARELLDLESFPDYGPMGIQVKGAAEVTKIAASVSSSLEAFRLAREAGAELLVVHHGLFWDNEPRTIDTYMRERLRTLFDGDITLAAYHLALDAHPELGNNAILARRLGLEELERFREWGYGGRLDEAATLPELAARLGEATGREPQVFEGGPDRIERVAVITGGAARLVVQAASRGYDAYITGEPAEPTFHLARELGIHFLAGGHYATETFGIKALAERLAEEFDVEWVFLDVPVPV